jgi:long-chain acyl-CoA synthetase
MRFTAACRRYHFNPGRLLFRRIHGLLGPRMRYLVTGGSRFDPNIARDYHALGIDVLEAYGLTETSGGAFANSPADNVIGSVGRPLKGVEAKISTAEPAEEGSPASGEILIRGPIVMKGYWNRPDATAEVLVDGWLHTGDLGYFDERGHLFLTGRKKEIIILANGKNIYPEEIEAHYRQSPSIGEICVLGLEGPAGSDKLHAVVVPDFENLRQRKVVNAKEVLRFDLEGLSAKLPSTKRITSYEIWQHDLPRTTTRKLKRSEIRKRVLERQESGKTAELEQPKDLSEEERSWLGQAEVGRALKVIAEYAPERAERIHPRDNLELDLGLDSMRRVELLVALEQALGGEMEESRVSEIYTVRELVDSLLAARTGTAARGNLTAGWSAVLEEEPSDPRSRSIIQPRPLVDRILFVLLRAFRLVWRTRSRLDVEGLSNLPRKGAYLLCSNHQSYLDPIPLLAVLPYSALERMFAVGTSEVFGQGVMRLVAKLLRVIVVDPDSNLVPAMRAGAFGLRHGHALVLYPEGERSIDGTPKTFKKGAAILSIHLQVPIVPVAIDGLFEAWPRGKPFQKFAPLQIKIGPPILPPAESDASEDSYQKLTTELRERVVTMWEELERRR